MITREDAGKRLSIYEDEGVLSDILSFIKAQESYSP